ncbi:MAG: aspartate aminotransferase family protein [Desulfobacteraceae bacterium]|nr:aspartate aminotransferase family protein [Desulfobacteraceae bacterium]
MNTKDKYKEFVNTAFMAAVEPLVLEKAVGASYFDEDGTQYLDCFAGISVVNSGHGNKAINAAAKAQIDKLVHCCSYVYHAKPVADLAEKLASITSGRLKKSFFGNGGAEAIEGALRLAKRFTGKNEILALTNSFHGRTYATLSLTGNCSRKKGGGPYMPGVSFSPAPNCYRCPFKIYDSEKCDMACADYLDEVIRCHTSDNVSLFIAEPVMGEGGIIVPPDNYFKRIKEILDLHNILFIADEVQSGFARTGKMFAIDHYDVEPDIMVMAKGIANGFPLSCFIARDEIADAFQPGDHLSTFGGNPVSCAASLANIDFMEQNNLSEQSNEKGRFLKEALKAIKPKNVHMGEIRGKGLMVGIELVEDLTTKAPAAIQAGKIRKAMREKGILIGVGGGFANVLRIQPPLSISKEELTMVVNSLKKILES